MPNSVIDSFKVEALKAVEENTLHFWSNLDVETHYTANSTLSLSGIPHPLLNGVLRTQFPPDKSDQFVADTIAHYKAKNLPFSWCLDHRTLPLDLGKKLEAAGFAFLGPIQGMALNLQDYCRPIPFPSPIKVLPVNSKEMLWQMGQILEKTYTTNAEVIQQYTHLLEKKGLTTLRPFRHYIAKAQQETVGCATLFIEGEIAGIYNLGVLEEYRHMGVAKELVFEIIQTAIDMNCRMIVLDTAVKGAHLFRKMGFVKICDFSFYVWPSADQELKESLKIFSTPKE
jgi:N-acetylglutamate synthase-like GNAT family acetyltransferase